MDIFGVDTEGEFNAGFFCVEFPGECQGDRGIISRIPETGAVWFCERGDLRIRDIEKCDACAQGADVFYRGGEGEIVVADIGKPKYLCV